MRFVVAKIVTPTSVRDVIGWIRMCVRPKISPLPHVLRLGAANRIQNLCTRVVKSWVPMTSVVVPLRIAASVVSFGFLTTVAFHVFPRLKGAILTWNVVRKYVYNLIPSGIMQKYVRNEINDDDKGLSSTQFWSKLEYINHQYVSV